MLHVYAIVDSAGTPEVAGLDGAELRTVGEETPFAVVSDHDRPSPRLSEDDLWAHEAVVEALMDRGATVLPMRFDGTVADEVELRRILDQRREEFETLLAAVRGAVELGVRAQLSGKEGEDGGDDDAGDERGPGTAYLFARARDQGRANEAVTRIHEPLAALSRQSRRSVAGALRPGLFKASYLVDRDRVEAFRARVDALDAELGRGRIVCTGPWPPYGFSSEERA